MQTKESIEKISVDELTENDLSLFRSKILEIKKSSEGIIEYYKSPQILDEKGKDRDSITQYQTTTVPVDNKAVSNARQTIIQCDNALGRMDCGNYGKCLKSGEMIPKEFLRVNPLRRFHPQYD